MDKKVNKKIQILLSNERKIQLPIIEATSGPDVIDVRNLYKETGYFTFDPGYLSTGSCESKITFIDGEKGILLHRGYPIEILAEKSNFLETSYLLLYGDLGQQPNLIYNPSGTSINHFIFYAYVSLLGFFIYSGKKNFQKLVYSMFFLSAILEILQYIVPNRAFQLGDLIFNILGVLVAYCVVKIYLLIIK